MMTLADLLCYLRQRLIVAREQKDAATLDILVNTFQLIVDAVLAHVQPEQRSNIVAIVDEMIDSVHDSFMGVEWKSNLPTVEEIITACLTS